jgi:hypothetical protein
MDFSGMDAGAGQGAGGDYDVENFDPLDEPSKILNTLRIQSLVLRERTIHLRSAAMEARALARDLRLRRSIYGNRSCV